ncbi:undecaprenyldiphospho-muramoylpentapeptide beta-N-acetylglucosaminyltransferase [Sphingorhabdus sp.]|jgi:UDP-N-acetylglucosamine--N-acetylmuramyl-(pentapeptide) pyrophosphoryl-undecaprenol N-acetylglucosamine transferase|uniref:undecaprenyldiphospho-muramoylpentapeptide beta-N-acetylglucosaminyltransferase n=1 Tax=Sphingorhabdus sp. TaxID=1902408 RepID=UPI0037C8FCE8
MTISRHYVLAAGGTGGHLIPAFALGQELINRGHHVALITDARGAKIPGCPDKMATHNLPAGRITKNPASWIPGIKAIAKGRAMARRLYENFEPSAVVGFGGYPAFPALLGAFAEKIPAIIHEQNAVLGRVNRFTARRVNAIATSYPDILRLSPLHASKVHLVGNPVREEVLVLRDQPYPPLLADGIFRVLVTGGSQGATVLSDVVPDGLSMLPLHLRRRLQVTQQCRAGDIDAVRAAYATHDIPAELATYLPDLPQRLGWAHMVISRAGASTIAELTCAGRPAILVPLPSATDDHQSYNVKEMVHAGGARAIAQPSFTAVELAKQIQKIALEPGALENAAKAAKNCGRPNAVADLADLVESFGRAPIMHGIKSKPQPSGGFNPSPALATETAA